ncbi:MAG: hypothetical protein ACRDYY_01290 [Acidimicrobiales bacterium]
MFWDQQYTLPLKEAASPYYSLILGEPLIDFLAREAGLEAAAISHRRMTITSLDPDRDSRAIAMWVASPAALLVAKAYKIGELGRLQPRELLGPTATPERLDGRDVTEWFDYLFVPRRFSRHDGRACYERRLLRPVRISLIRISGCSSAAKCPPLSASP